jgi:hypothetical protein
VERLPGDDPLDEVLQLSRDDLLAALPKAERLLAYHREAAQALEARIRLVRQLLGVEMPVDPTVTSAVKSGKYDALEAWLRRQPRVPTPMRFRQIEEIIGRPLPVSSRRYAAHWHSWEGSAVSRAIRRAGWSVRELRMTEERLLLVPVPEYHRVFGLRLPKREP